MAKAKTTTKTVKKSSLTQAADKKPVKNPDNSKKIVKTVVIFLGIFLFLGIIGYIIRTRTTAAFVNGVAIGRMDIFNTLEKTQGKQVLDSLIVKELLLQEAKKQNISVSDEEINTEITKIKDELNAQGQDFDSILSQQGLTLIEVQNEIRLQKILEKLLADRLIVTDEEVAAYIEQNKQYLSESTDTAKLQEETKAQIKSQKLSTEAQAFIQTLKAKADLQYFGIYKTTPSSVEPVQAQ